MHSQVEIKAEPKAEPKMDNRIRFVRQGTITSSQNPLPGHEEEQRATILPLRQDGSIYTGVLTFTATEPVDVVMLNIVNLNETERAIINGTEWRLWNAAYSKS